MLGVRTSATNDTNIWKLDNIRGKHIPPVTLLVILLVNNLYHLIIINDKYLLDCNY